MPMQIESVRSLDDLAQYLREYTNFTGDAVAFDFAGAFLLYRACLDSLACCHLDSDLAALEEKGFRFTEEQTALLKKLDQFRV